MFVLNSYKLYANGKVVFILWWMPLLFIKEIVEIYYKQLLLKLSTGFSIIFSISEVAECSSTYWNPPAKEAGLELSEYMEVDKVISANQTISAAQVIWKATKITLKVMMKSTIIMSETILKILFKAFFLSFEIICNSIIVTLKPLINMYLFYPNSYINFVIVTLRILTRMFIKNQYYKSLRNAKYLSHIRKPYFAWCKKIFLTI